MERVNIYICTTVKGPGARDGTYTYLLEYITEKGPVTLTKQGELKGMTENRAQLRVLQEALKRLRKPCEVEIYTDSVYLQQGAEVWLKRWRDSGWLTARGKPVANREEWEKTAELLGRHLTAFRTEEEHSYRNWLKAETEKKEKERKKCLNGSEK